MSVFSPHALAIEGFLCFGVRQIFYFPSSPGVYRITGVNEVQPRLVSNGSGKTSLFDAYCWCLFGKTTKGVFGPKVKSWHRKKTTPLLTEVAFEGFKDQTRFVVSRTQDPNILKLDGRVVVQKELDEFLERDYERFLATSMFSSRKKGFMDLGVTEQTAQLSSVLSLDSWAERAHQARSFVVEQETKLQSRKLEFEKTQERLKINRALLLDLVQEKEAYANKVVQLKLEDAQKLEELKATLPHVVTKPVWLEVFTERDRLRELQGVRADAITRTKQLRDELLRYKETHVRKTAEVEKLTQEEVCPTCQQSWSATQESQKVYLNKLERDLSKIEIDAQGVKKQLGSFKQAAQECDHDIQQVMAEAVKEEQDQLEQKRAHEDQLQQVGRVQAQRSQMLKSIRELEAREYPPYDEAMLRRTQRAIEVDTEGERGLVQEQRELETVISHHRFWVEAFLKIRLSEMERACAEFQIYFQNAFEVLGLVGWEIQISFTKELASKKSAKQELNIQIKSPESPEFIPWECWSDGQQHRLKIEGMAAFADLVSSRLGVRDLLECWDEQTNSLGPEGCEDQMEYFQTRSRARQTRLLVIDHRTGTYPFQKTFTVRNTRNGAVLEQ